MAYGGNPSGSNTDAVRLLVHDLSTSTGAELLADAEYTFFINRTNTLDEAAEQAALALAAKYSGDADKAVGDLKISLSQKAKAYLALASQLGTQSAEASLVSVSPYLGGRSLADKQSVESDTDRAAPSFTRNQFDFPGAADPQRSTGL